MSEHTWSTGDKPPASQFEEDLHKQTVIRCTSTTHGTLWAGKHLYETDTDLHYYSPDGTTVILQPKPVAKTDVADTGVGGFIVSGPYDINGSLLTFNSQAGIRYKLTWNWRMSGVAGDVFVVNAWRGSTHIDLQMDCTPIVNGIQTPFTYHLIDTPGKITPVTYKLTIERTIGAGGAPFGGAIKGGTDCWAEEFDDP